MKTISTIGTIVIIAVIFGFTTGELGKYQPLASMPTLTIEKALASNVSQNAVAVTHDEQAAQDNSIFSWPTILLLSAAVVGIVAFRRNSYD